jgi:putative intracellular protease/amidase
VRLQYLPWIRLRLRLSETRRTERVCLRPGLPLRRFMRVRQHGRGEMKSRWALLVCALVCVPAFGGRARPLIAVVGENAGTELIDFVIPYGILSQSDAADVLAVGTSAGPMQMRPALRVRPQATLESFDQRFPDGADYVIVPAVVSVGKNANAALLAWITTQSGKGATIVSICDGALIVARTGLLKGHRATGHWATQAMREHDFPETVWLENTRYVVDGKFISSAGVTAAIPLSLALVETIAGTARAEQVAKDLGVGEWSSAHDSEQFRLRAGSYFTAIRNWLSPGQEIGLPVGEGVDDIALALTADAFSRTYRSHAYTVASSAGAIQTLHGLTLLPDRVTGEHNAARNLRAAFDATPSAQVLDVTLADIARKYGRATARFVALQLEY